MAQAEFIRKIEHIDPRKIVYVDETGFDQYYCRTHCYAKRGVIVDGNFSGKRFERTNLVAGLHDGKLVGHKFFKHSANSLFFEDWFETHLLPSIPRKSIIVMDNATFHRKKILRRLARKTKCQVVFLPAYSPCLNPIEKWWANCKRFLSAYLFTSLLPSICAYFKFN